MQLKSRGAKAASKAGAPEPFPPPTISAEAWLEHGSDKRFRTFIGKVLELSSMLLESRARLGALVGLTPPQFSLVTLVSERPGESIRELADAMRVQSPFVTAEVGKLIGRGLVRKRPSKQDGRRASIELTEAGAALIKQLAPFRQRVNDMIYGRLDRAQVDALVGLVDILHTDIAVALHEMERPGGLGTPPS